MKPITIYTTTHCSYCGRAKDLLQRLGLAFTEVDATGRDDLRQELVDRTGRRTMPQIFIGDESIGGYDDLAALHASGRLDALVKDG